MQGAHCNVIPQQVDYQAGISGPLLRAWQGDPFNTNSMYFAGYDTSICTLALTSAIGAPWVTKKGPLTSKGVSQPVFEGVAPTNHVTSTDCGDNCVFTSKKLMSTALVSLFPVVFCVYWAPVSPAQGLLLSRDSQPARYWQICCTSPFQCCCRGAEHSL
jgi:hypothetical protein